MGKSSRMHGEQSDNLAVFLSEDLENLGVDGKYSSNQDSKIDLPETGRGKLISLVWLRLEYRGSLLLIR